MNAIAPTGGWVTIVRKIEMSVHHLRAKTVATVSVDWPYQSIITGAYVYLDIQA
jgi:hypothetical protein